MKMVRWLLLLKTKKEMTNKINNNLLFALSDSEINNNDDYDILIKERYLTNN